MRLLITGSREGHMYVDQALDAFVELHGMPDVIIVGDARGVDTQAQHWAKRNLVPFREYAAYWEEFGNAAGPLRNTVMVAEMKPCDYCIAFFKKGAANKGTSDCSKKAEAKGLTVIKVWDV